MSVSLSPTPIQRFFDNNGNPLINGLVYTYAAGTTTPVSTYQNTTGTLNTNPIQLDARGEAYIWLTDGQYYKFVITDSSGNTIKTVDQIASAGTIAAAAVSSPGGFLVTATGATKARSLSDYFSDRPSIYNYTNTTTPTPAEIQAALNALPTGGEMFFPPATYDLGSTTIAMPRYVKVVGAGYHSTIFTYSGTGAAFKSSAPINSSTGVYNGIANLQIKCTNASNTDGGYVDVGGTFVNIDRCLITGFKYGIIFDQTELSDITECVLDSNTTAQVWLADGNYTGGASSQYTNRISISKCQISGASTAYGILDDGGYTHSFIDNNYNGLRTHIRACGVHGLKIDGGEYESATSSNIVLSNLDLAGATHGQSTNVCITHAIIVPSVNNYCIDIVSAGNINLIDNFYGNNAYAAVHGCAGANAIYSMGNYMAGSNAMFDANATYHTSFDASATGAPFKHYYNSSAISEGGAGFVLGSTGTRLLAGAVNSANQIFLQGVNPGVGYTRSVLLQPLGGRLLIGTSTDDGVTMAQLAGGMAFTTAITAASAANNTLFRDSADNKLKFKDNAGTVNLLY